MVDPKNEPKPLIGVVGPCGSGKTTITDGLRNRGVNIKSICQEHSYVPSMWQRLTKPDVLIFLDASYEETSRRKRLSWFPAEYDEQHRRLRHAREHADFYFFTDGSTPRETLDLLYKTLLEHGVVTPGD